MNCDFCNQMLEETYDPGFQCFDCKLTYHFYSDEVYIDKLTFNYYICWLSTSNTLTVYDVGDNSCGDEVITLSGEKFKCYMNMSDEIFLINLNKLILLK